MHTGRERVNGIHHRKFITHTFFNICQIHEKENFKNSLGKQLTIITLKT